MSVIRLKYFYKAYHLDRSGGIRNLELIEAMSDQDAVEQLRDRGYDHEIEVWDRTRLVGRVESSAFGVGAVPSVSRIEAFESHPEVA